MISEKEVKHIAKLARLGLTEKEIKKFQTDLSKILDYVDKLKEVDISNVDPTSHSVKLEKVVREDEIKEKNNSDLMELAPDKKNGFLKVKSVF